MKSVRYLALLALLLLAGCRDHKETVPAEIAEILGLGISRPLEVLLASPQGETGGPKDYEAITVVFNQPMKGLSAEAPDIDAPFTVSPEANGKFRWKGTATVSFVPNQPLRYGTEYTVTVPAGLKAASGQTLAKAYTFTFSTPGPRVIQTLPGNNSSGYKNGEPIVLGFDQTVDPAKVASLLSFTLPKDAPAVKVRALTEAEAVELNKDRSLTFVPRRSVLVEVPPLAQGTTYNLTLKDGLVGEVGPRPGVGKELSFTTLGPLEWTGSTKYGPTSPDEGISFPFSNEVSYKVLKQHVKISPAVSIPSSDWDDEMEYSSPSLYLDLAPNTRYTVTVGKDLTDVHGQKLGKDVTFTWQTGDRRPSAQMAEGVALLEANGKLAIPMGLQNISSQEILLIRVDSAEMMRLAAMETYDWLWGQNAVTPDGVFRVKKTLKPDGPKNEMYDSPLDLTPVLQGRKYGFVYYQVVSHGPDQDFTHRGLVQITNLGATGKFSPENSLFVATALDTAQTLGGVDAVVADGSGRQVWKGRTGADGRVEAPGWSSLLGDGYDRYQDPPMTLMLTRGEDQVFIRNGAFGSVWASMFDINSRWDNSVHQPAAFVYTERGLYLPGEEVQLKGALRDREGGEWVNAKVDQLSFQLFNSRDESVETGTVTVSSYGTFHHTLKIAANAPSGAYRVDYSLPQSTADSWRISPGLTGVSFRVEEFQPAEFEVEVTSPVKAASMGSSLSFEVLGSWLFGSPMNAEKVEWSSYVEPARYSNEAYPNYDFGPLPLDNGEQTDTHQTLSEGKGVTDNKGLYKAQLSTQGLAYKGDADLTVEATIQSSNRRSVTNRMVLPLSRGAYRVGLLPSTRFAQGGQGVTVRAVTLTPEGEPVDGKKLKVELIRREWNSTRKTDADGSYRWVTEVEDQIVRTQEVESDQTPLEMTLQPEKAGYYVVRASGTDDAANTIVSETSFYSQGMDYIGWGRSDGDMVELVADKPQYKPGDTAKILIKSPYKEATALVTYERDLILHSYTTTLKGSAPVIEVPLTEKHLPNLYVSVMLLRGRVADEASDPEEDTGKPAFKMGYLDLPVVPDSQRLKVQVTTDKERYGPGDEVVTTLKVTDQSGKPVQAELSLTAADVGVLNLIDYQTPDFFDTFYASLPLAVRTAESRLDVIGQRSYGTKGEESGGGGGYNPGYRTDFRLTAVWKPQVETDLNGQAEVRFRLPENLTTFRVMATAIDKKTRCGKADSEIILTKPLILKASAPAFARLGDEFQAGVLAVNGSGQDSTLKLSMTAEGIDAKPEPQEVFLKAGEEREILFPLKATTEGTAVLRFDGALGQNTDALQVEIPLKPAYQRTTLASNGNTTEASVKETAQVPDTAVAGTIEVALSLAPTMLNGLQTSIEQLVDYPYGCLEQRLSRITPMLFTDDLVARFGLKGWNESEARAEVQQNLDLIPNYVHSSGGLKVWPDSTDPNPYLTALAVRTAHMASERGYKVGDAWLPGARSYLKSYLDKPDNRLLDFNVTETLVTRAAALEALTRYDFAGQSYLNVLMDRRSALTKLTGNASGDKRAQMSVVGKAFLLEAAHRLGDKEAEKILATELTNAIKIENATAYFDVDETTTPWLYSDDVHDTGLVLAAMLNTEQKLPVADKVVKWLLEARNAAGTWSTTSNNAAALSALWAYSQAFEGKEGPDFTVSGKVGDQEIAAVEFSGTKLEQSLQTFELKPGSSTVDLKKDGEGRLYYSVSVSYQDSKPSPAKDEGMTVLRALMTLDDKPATEIKGGEIYKVRLSVVAPDLRRFVSLEDPVPAGLSVVKTDFATESSRLASLLKSGRGDGGSWQTFCRFETYNDRILLFADALAPGEHYYEYLVRAQTPGTYLHPAAQVEEMYHPEVFGRTSTGTLTVIK